ncbi:MAG TPA: CHAP domain-containing protein [Coleofasciculaceae cyanobacterium]
MMQSYAEKRALLAKIALQEGELKLRGNENKAGLEIEKYLNVFRDAFNNIENTTKYSNQAIGFQWCCAFAYYCCLQAGFSFPVKPIPSHRSTLGVVRVWYDWANLPENQFYHSANAPNFEPRAGDIILFDRLLENVELDHIGIVVNVASQRVVTAEGNVKNQSGIFAHPFDQQINGYIRLSKF